MNSRPAHFLHPISNPLATGAVVLLAFGLPFALPAAQTWDFNHGLPADLALFGNAVIADGGGPDGSGYLSLTEALPNQNGALRFPGPLAHLDQIRVRFKVRIADGTGADGFSLTVAPDLPAATYGTGESGYRPAATDLPRFIVSFDTWNNGGKDFPGISVIVNGKAVAELRSGETNVPELFNADGTWAEVDIQLQRSGKLNLTYGGVKLLNEFQTDFAGIDQAVIGLDARTGGSYETHWFDDLSVDYADGDGGPLAISPESELGPLALSENVPGRLAVVPTGIGPFTYQWSWNGAPLEGRTSRVLPLTGLPAEAGSYAVTVTNGTGSISSTAAEVTIVPDTAAPLVQLTATAGGTVNTLLLQSDEPLDSYSAGLLTHYAIPGLEILSAALSPDGRSILLNTSPQLTGKTYTLTVTGIPDRSVAANAFHGTVKFTAQPSYSAEVLADAPVRYWQFEEASGTAALSSAFGANTSETALISTLQGGEFSETPSLLAGQTTNHAAALASGTWILAPNGSDLNSGGPYPKKTIEFWFRPAALPPPDVSGLQAAIGLYEQGGSDRGINLYLWRNPENQDPDQASLVFHSLSRLSDGPGTPYGLSHFPALYTEYPQIRAGQTYHVAAVFDGDVSGTNGKLLLYINGLEVKQVTGLGQIYSHTSDIRIGQGNARIHTNDNGILAPFEGAIDELALYNTALPPERITAHYYTGIGSAGAGAVTLKTDSDLTAKTTQENTPVEFSVIADGAGPFTYQWFRNGTAIAGATGRILSLSGSATEAGQYSVRVANATNEVTGGPVTLSITSDLLPLSLQSAAAIAGTVDQVNLVFQDPVDLVSGTNPATFPIPGLTVLQASLTHDGRTVILHTSPQQEGTAYTLGIEGLRDRSAAGNPIFLSVPLTARSDYRYEVLADQPVRYWRFEETSGTTAASLASGLDISPVTLSANFKNGELTANPSLLASQPEDHAALFDPLNLQYFLVPNGSDLNAIRGPWTKKSVELWFNATTVPAADTEGISAASGLWEQGGTTRGLALYLWRNPSSSQEDQVSLVFHSLNDSATDGPGSPFGLNSSNPVFVEVPGIQAGRTYHVLAVFDGDSTGTTGQIILYLNGVEAGRAGNAGQLYNHTADVRIGSGNTLLHSGASGDLQSFDGLIDEVAVYNSALSAARAAAHYEAGSGQQPAPAAPAIHSIHVNQENAVIQWSGGVLQRSTSLDGPWQDVPEAAQPHLEPVHTATRQFFRVLRR